MMKSYFLKKLFSFLAFVMIAGFAFGQTGVFFSEYIEGGSNNKAIEIYNGTGASVDLSQYLILQNSNGGPWNEYVDQLSGTLADGDVYVIANGGSNAAILAVTDVTGTGICYFNGDDARALVKIDTAGTDSVEWTITGNPGYTHITVLDYIGTFPADPGSGWNVAGVTNGTKDHTLVRKHTITSGNTDWAAAAGTDSLNSEWLVYPKDTVGYLGAHTMGVTTVDVTMNVNMTYQTTLGNFNPATDFVDIAGSMNAWGGTAMTDTDGDNIWTTVITGVNAGDVLEYKFRINGTSWESVGNRFYTAVAGANVVDHWYDDNAGPQDVTFTIVDGTAAYIDIEMKGSFDGWAALYQMYDDGTNGDVTAGDHTWTLLMSIAGGSWEWGAIENDGSTGGLWLIDGGNPAFTVNTDGSVTGQTEYIIPVPGTEDVIFNVNMNHQITLGNFNASTDSVDIAGNFNGFGGSVAMDDTDGDGIYSITIGGFAPADVAEFKFRINTNWESLANNRTYTVIGGGVDDVTYWYNNETPAPPAGLFFSEYIEGSSNHKALEIYNGTGATVDLFGLSILTNYNGNAWSGLYEFPMGASLADGDVWVLAHESADSVVISVADETFPYGGGGYITSYNGDDVRALVYITSTDTTIIDIIGKYDLIDPGSGWDVAGVSSATANHTIVRKSSVTVGNTDWDASAGTDAANSEWVVFDQNTFDYIGSHPHILIAQEDLTVNVNMSYQVSIGNFDPLNDTIYVVGSFDGWTGTEMADADGDSIYTVVLPDLYVDTLYEYKFRINSGNWESLGNRQYTMVSGTNTVDHWFNDATPPSDVLFTVIDGTLSYLDIEIKGSFNGWTLAQMYDDGSNGDVTAGDNTWSLLMNIPGGTWEWGAIENDGSPSGLWLIDGTNPTFTLNPDGSVTGQVSYDIPAPGSDSVEFNVNMNYQITLGNFDPLLDVVDIAGNFNGWGGTAMSDADADGIYTLTVDGFTPADVAEFKFRINGNWESFSGNRTHTVVGGGVDVFTAWYNNEEPPPPNELFFSEYIEGSSYNKALEIYNNTGATVNLDDYRIAQAVNGGGWGYYHAFPAAATLADGDVWVMAADGISPSLYDTSLADEVLSYPSVTHHNGDDARAIIKISGTDTTFVDIFGNPDNDPGDGWAVAGIANATKDHTLIRKTSVVTGNTDWANAFGTNATDSEWKILDINTFDYLGFHPHVFDTIVSVTFNVNMSYQQTLGTFDPLVDYVDIAGNMNGWAGGDTLLDPDFDMIYSITFDSVDVATVWNFKFRINGSWSDLTCEFPYGGPNREYIVQDGTNVVDYWYSDEQPAPVVTIYDIQYTTDPSGDSPYDSQLIETSGTVTGLVPYGYFIQDGIGMWNGVYVYDTGNLPAIGDNITLVAEVAEYYNLTELKNLNSYTLNSSGNVLPPAVVVSTNDLATMEAYEGVLVQVVSATCTDPDMGYGEWQLDDGTGPCVVDDMIYTFSPDSAHSYDVTGLVYYSYGEFKLQPRDSADIVDVTVAYDIQTISIVSGWSIFSTYIDAYEPSLDSIFSLIVNEVVIVKDGNGTVYWPQFGLNAIGNLTISEGYQINILSVQSIDIIGTLVVPETTPFDIMAGWSIIGYLRTDPADVAVLFTSIVSEIILMKNGNGVVYWPLYNLNAIGNMMPGEGYQMNMSTTQSYTFPANGPLGQTSKSYPQPVILNQNINTGSNMTLGIPVSAWETIPATGSEIAVYNQKGELCGSTVFTGQTLAIAIWGDDEITPQAEAMQNGEAFSLKIWNRQSNETLNINIDNYIVGNGNFAKDAIAVAANVNIEGRILQNYPNPASTYTEIEFSISTDEHVNLSIFNALGEKMEMPLNGNMLSGTHKVLVNTVAYKAGVYFYTLKTTSSTQTKAMQVIK
ncbi:MAG: lamin tail domain-containing protein [Bacteroidota bacterium]|nr:lamin tail domain-containing protein [Bacteroidota bacterium]